MLGEGYLGSGFTLAEARVIYELANREAPSGAVEIRESGSPPCAAV